jgi:dihydrolipoamide dehydrogenase
MSKKYDLAVIGGGPGGYAAAIKAKQLGLNTVIVEKYRLGGTCLHVGCIPTKTLISSAHVYSMMQTAKQLGIEFGSISFDYHKMKERKDKVVAEIWKGLNGLVTSHGVDVVFGNASFISSNKVKVIGESDRIIEFDRSIIATGSKSAVIPPFPIDKHKIHDSSSILEITKLPEHLIVLGGGYIGCEFASLYSQLGVKVSIVEFMDGLVVTQGTTISKFLQKAFEKRKIDLYLQTKMESINTSGSGVIANLSNGKTLSADALLVCVGRTPFTEGLHLEKAGVFVNERGFIPVNENLETSQAGIYAIGDVIGGAMLAHVASHEGLIAAINASGKKTKVHYHSVPAVIFTDPEIATVGMTEEQAKDKGFDVASAQFPNIALGKAVASLHTEGFSEMIFDKKTHQILGATLIGYEAGNMIGEMAVAIHNELTIECIGETIHPHPTLGETWMELAHVAEGSPIHIPSRKKS